MIKIQNVVASVKLGQKVDMKKAWRALEATYLAYTRPTFPGLIVRGGRAAFLIFKTGSIICVGTNSVDGCVKSVKNVHDKLVEAGAVQNNEFTLTIENIVATGNLGKYVDLPEVVEKMEHVIYEPEIFPAAILYMQRPRVCTLLFQNGKVVICGAKYENEVHEAYNRLINMLNDGMTTGGKAAGAGQVYKRWGTG